MAPRAGIEPFLNLTAIPHCLAEEKQTTVAFHRSFLSNDANAQWNQADEEER
jgi:hypothetical protein